MLQIPIIQKEGIEFLEQFIKEHNIEKILEIGTAIGYSACQFAKYTSCECIIDTIELDSQRAEDASYF